METLTTNTQATANYNQIASDIMELFDQLGFTSDIQNDPAVIQRQIVDVIRKTIEGNVNYASTTG
jgi:hypothetical protein